MTEFMDNNIQIGCTPDESKVAWELGGPGSISYWRYARIRRAGRAIAHKTWRPNEDRQMIAIVRRLVLKLGVFGSPDFADLISSERVVYCNPCRADSRVVLQLTSGTGDVLDIKVNVRLLADNLIQPPL